MKTLKLSVPGKIILMGEHAVVHGRPAIVAAVNRRMTCEINTVSSLRGASKASDAAISINSGQDCFANARKDGIITKIKSQIPIGCGMGSSAAWSVIQAASRLFFERVSVSERIEKFDSSRLRSNNKKMELSPNQLAKINQMAWENEKIYHLNSSGVDPAICTYGGVLWYQKLKSGKKIFRKIESKHLPKFVLINTGKPQETTGQMVKKIKYKVERKKHKAETLKLFDEIERQTKLFMEALISPSLRAQRSNLIKNCIQNCESCLEDLGIVGDLAKKIVREIEDIGGAAKISGGGGVKKGSGILLCYHENPLEIIRIAQKNKLENFEVKLGTKGLIVETF